MAVPARAFAMSAALQLLMGSASDPSCKCLNWREVYASGRARCGEGAELFAVHQRIDMTPKELHELYESARIVPVCDDFFRRLDNNLCANIAHSPPTGTDWHAGTWCYVSSECRDLGGGRRLGETPVPWMDRLMGLLQGDLPLRPGSVSWKICTPATQAAAQDAQLRDLPLEEVFALSDRLELDAGLTIKHSLWNSWVFWHQIQDDWAAGRLTALPEVLRDAMAKGTPVIVDTRVGGVGDLKVIRGRELHSLRFKPGPKCGPTKFCRSMEAMPAPTG